MFVGAPPPKPPSEAMSDIKKKLDGLREQLGLVSAKDISPETRGKRKVPPEKTAPGADRAGGVLSNALAAQLRARMLSGAAPTRQRDDAAEAAPVEIDGVLRGEYVGDPDSAFFLLRKRYALDHAVGDVPLGAALRCGGREIALSACDDALLEFDPRTACFMDTETTGLAGGAGTVAFLVGMGFFDAQTFVLEQCFLRDYDDEAPMLTYLAQKLAAFATIVSYNGKSFDLPLLRARFVQHRIPFPLDGAAHYDLVHAARRVWKKRLNNCALNNIEKEVLGLHRRGDVPGCLIPQLWLDYLDTRDARPLVPVFYHHEMDILSLAALAGYLAQRLAADNSASFRHAEDRLAVVRLYVRNKNYESAIAAAQRFLETSIVRDELRRECFALLGKSCKKAGLFEDMAQAWARMHEEYPDDAGAAAELAKYREHQERDIAGAITVCRETLTRIETDAPPADFSISALRGRLARLEKKRRKLQQRLGGDNAFFADE